ncbi:MAG: M15 family metallopeptidase [Eubacteriales bacterium]
MGNNRRLENQTGMSDRERANRLRKREERRRKNKIRTAILLGIGLVVGCLMGGLLGGSSKDLKTQVAELEAEISDLVTAEEVEDAAQAEAEAGAIAWEEEKEQWYLRLVNQSNPIGEDEEIELAEVNGYYIDVRVEQALLDLLEAGTEAGTGIYIRSAYRDWDTQALYFGNMLEMYVEGGYSYYEAYLEACIGVAVPGESEHQLGLAVDLISSEYETLDEGQADTEVAEWLKENASDYGFILRYPEGKEDITGIMFEPWHYRYVGVEAATYIMDNDITLEEYLELEYSEL